MDPETSDERRLDAAAGRLERAVAALESRLGSREGDGDLFEGPPGEGLQAEFVRAKSRARELEAAGEEASAALGRAIHEIRSALAGETEEGDR